MLTVRISGVNSAERFDQIKEVLLDRQIHRNAPLIYADFTKGEDAHLAVTNLNQLPGIKADIVEDQYNQCS